MDITRVPVRRTRQVTRQDQSSSVGTRWCTPCCGGCHRLALQRQAAMISSSVELSKALGSCDALANSPALYVVLAPGNNWRPPRSLSARGGRTGSPLTNFTFRPPPRTLLWGSDMTGIVLRSRANVTLYDASMLPAACARRPGSTSMCTVSAARLPGLLLFLESKQRPHAASLLLCLVMPV